VYEGTTLTDYHLQVYGGDAVVGAAGRISADVATRYDLDEPLFFAEVSLDRLSRLSGLSSPAQYAGISRFPIVERDLAFVVDAGQEVGPLLETIAQAGGDLVRHVRPFDLYSGKGVPEGRKSVAISLTFGAERTLTDDEVESRIRAVVESVRAAYGAELRR
jgi:phenylalanyl-tRNA synthetase beta chain